METQETGDRRREMGDRRRDTGDERKKRRWETGDMRRKPGDRRWETGDGKQYTGQMRREGIYDVYPKNFALIYRST